MADDRTTKAQPRPEARPVVWAELTSQQQEAAKELCALLAEQSRLGKRSRFFERDKLASGLIQVLPPIELERWSGVHLIDGERGAGKTALLVSLLHHWGQVAQGREPWLAEVEAVPGILPIGLFDLRDLPKQTALKVHLASMLRRIYEFVCGPSGEVVPLPGQPRNKEEPLRIAWEDFVRATAADVIEFKGRGASDPETFAEDIFAAEKDRFDLQALFCKFIDQLLERYARCDGGKRGDALFVIAIDDADMNPGKVMECLELTQTFAHPRVTYLLTGHEDLYLIALERYFEHELHGASEAAKEARRLAAKFYEKVIPATHRRRLRALEPSERVDRLEDVLKGIPMPRLRNDAATVFRAFPEFAELLPPTMRELQELGRRLEQRLRDAKASPAWQLLVLAYDATRVTMPDETRRLLDPLLWDRPSEPKTGRLPFLLKFVQRPSGSQVHGSFAQDGNEAAIAYANEIWLRHVEPPINLKKLNDLDESESKENPLLILTAVLFGDGTSAGDLNLVTIANKVNRVSWPIAVKGLPERLVLTRVWSRWFAMQAATLPLEQLARAFFECHILAADLHLDDLVLHEWSEVIGVTVNRGDLDELALLAAPEYGLDVATRRRLLDGWRAAVSPDVWQTKRTHWARARDGRVQADHRAALRKRYGEDDPWFVAMEHEEDLGPLQTILDAPLHCKNPWTSTLGEYLTDDLRDRLLRDRGAILELSELLGRPPRTDERQRLASIEANIGHWTGTRLNLRDGVAFGAVRWGELRALDEGADSERAAVAEGEVYWGNSGQPLAVQIAFLLALDLSTDRQGSGGMGSSPWPLFVVERPKTGDQATPWQAPSWQTHVDIHRAVDAWNRVCAGLEVSSTTIGALARAFVMIHVQVFLRVSDEPAPRSWPDLFDHVEAAITTKRHIDDSRMRMFRAWFDALGVWLPNTLPPHEFVALAHELRRNAAVVKNVERTWRERLTGLPHALNTPVLASLDGMLDHFDREARLAMPQLFELGKQRRDALARFGAELRSIRDDGWLTPDLEGMLADSSANQLEAALDTYERAGKGIAGLVAVWRTSAVNSDVRYGGGRLLVGAAYLASPVFGEPDVIESEVPALTVRYWRGAMSRPEQGLIAEVVRALLAELAEPPPASQSFAPITWSLACYRWAGISEDILPWPAVQWPQRRDVYAQLTAWHAMLDRSGSKPLSSVIRSYIAATIDIYETGQSSGVYAGSWDDVITRARQVARSEPSTARERAFAGWVEQIPRFALPRVGLPHKYAADILVRFWDLDPTSDAIRGELIGRLDDFHQKQLGLPIPLDHPAKRVSEAKDLDDLRAVMDDLRRTYELG